jgi:hypothetical protein
MRKTIAYGETSALASEAAAEGQAAAAATVAANVASTSAVTRDDVLSLSKDFYTDHLFDKYLHFASAEDEADYRRRTAAMQAYIAKEMARGTPEGNLNAGGCMASQLLEADTHGAGKSPDFLPKWNKLVGDVERERAALKAAGQSTAEFDRTVSESVRRFLKSKGLSDAEIDKRLANGADPLAAVQPFLQSDSDRQTLENQIGQTASSPAVSLTRVEATAGASTRDTQLGIDFAALAAKSRAAGLQVADAAEPSPAHGLAIGKPPGKAGPGVSSP